MITPSNTHTINIKPFLTFFVILGFMHPIMGISAIPQTMVLDLVGNPIKDAKVKGWNEQIDVTLTNKQFVLDLRKYKFKEDITVSINDAIGYHGEIPKTKLLYFSSKASSMAVDESFFKSNPTIIPTYLPNKNQTSTIPSNSTNSHTVPTSSDTQRSYIPIENNTSIQTSGTLSDDKKESSIEIIKTKDLDTIRLPNVLFSKNQYDLNTQSKKVFIAMGPLFTHSFAKIIITGHTDSSGKPDYNIKLSNKRASTIRDLLVKEFKIPAGKVEIIGVGSSEPEADDSTELGRQMNRRVTIQIIREQ